MEDLLTERSVEPNEFGQMVWNEVAHKLHGTGFHGVNFSVNSPTGAPFEVEVSGPIGPARSVVNPGFQDKLRKTLREVIADNSPVPSKILTKGSDWPPFTIKLSQEIQQLETFTPTNEKSSYHPIKLTVPENEPPIFEPSRPMAHSRPEKTPEKLDTVLPDYSPVDRSIELRTVYEPNDGRLRAIASDVAELVVEKNQAYGNSFHSTGAFLNLLYPNGVAPEQMGDMLTIVRIFDKLKRIATNKRAFGESPMRDIIGYSLLALEREMSEPSK